MAHSNLEPRIIRIKCEEPDAVADLCRFLYSIEAPELINIADLQGFVTMTAISHRECTESRTLQTTVDWVFEKALGRHEVRTDVGVVGRLCTVASMLSGKKIRASLHRNTRGTAQGNTLAGRDLVPATNRCSTHSHLTVWHVSRRSGQIEVQVALGGYAAVD